ncbi:MAG: hypothetical protein Q9169_007048 [Polycauliona sp. 2 TL-2023]
MDPTTMPPGYLQQDKGPMLVKVIWVFAALALIVVCLKAWTRLKVLHQSGLEDLFMLLAEAVSLVYGALLTAAVNQGLGKHAAALEPDALVRAIRLYTKALPFGMLSVTLPMFAIAIVLDNITAPSNQQRRLLYAFPTLNLIIRVVNVILVFTQCFTAASVIFLTVWPIVAFWRLRLKMKDRIILPVLFGTTAIAAACILVRVSYIPQMKDYDDFTYTSVDYTVWVVIEADIFIITACIPGLRAFVKYLRQKISDGRILPSAAIPTPKKSNRNSEITVPASSLSLNQVEPQSAASVAQSQQSLLNEHLRRERSPGSVPPRMEDVERQAPERWRASEDTR